jgi:hypothetical protein
MITKLHIFDVSDLVNNRMKGKVVPRAKYKVVCKTLDKNLVTLVLNNIIRELEATKANNGGTLPHGAISRMVSEKKATLTWLTKDMIKYHLKKLNKIEVELLVGGDVTAMNLRRGASSALTLASRGSNTASTLTVEMTFGSQEQDTMSFDMVTMQDQYTTAADLDTTLTCMDGGASTHNDGTTRTCMDGGASTHNGGGTTTLDTNASFLVGGRPKGSTMALSRDYQHRIKMAINDTAEQYSAVRQESKMNNLSRAPRGVLTKIIAASKEKYNLHHSTTIKIETIRTRVKKKETIAGGIVAQGTPSPMIAIEPYIVQIVSQLAKMRTPICISQGLLLANSIISETPTYDAVLEWKQKHNVHFRNNGKTALGPSYWRGFMKRNKHLIASKKAVKFDSKRADWCTYNNFETMYNEVYEEMVKGGIAWKLNSSVKLNKAGSIVEHTHEQFGLETKYDLLRPDKLLFVDEVGSNTSQTKDGNIGGEKFVCGKEQRPQQRSATKDAHFTVLGFTAANGLPVMCAIIFAAKELEESWILGFDATVEWEGAEDNIQGNTGRNKRYPMGPTCVFNGITVPTFCCCSENGSITAELLVEMLKVMDRLNVFDRADNVPPFLILDGHGSRFDLLFLQYVNAPETKWNVCIGVPYGTSYWQVGDSVQQNGCFKMALTRYKRELLTKKENRRAEFAIEKDEIVDLVARAWEDSFARVETNKTAIAERGWGPLNYNILLHDEIQLTSTSQSEHLNSSMEERTIAVSTITPAGLNLNRGIAGILLDKVIVYRNREDARNGINLDDLARQRKETALQAIAQNKRYTAGLHVAAGRFKLGTETLEDMTRRKRMAEERESEKSNKKLQDHNTLRDKIQAIRALNKEPHNWTVAQTKTMATWYKRIGDPPLPNTKLLLLTRYNETVGRGDPQAPAAGALPPPVVMAMNAVES